MMFLRNRFVVFQKVSVFGVVSVSVVTIGHALSSGPMANDCITSLYNNLIY